MFSSHNETSNSAFITVYFDGVCNLCNGAVDWIISRDKNQVFHFASLQGENAQKLPSQFTTSLQSIVLQLPNGQLLTESDAVIEILSQIPGYRWLAIMIKIFPRAVRNWGYQIVAHYRYQIFGKRDTCRVPTESEKARFLP